MRVLEGAVGTMIVIAAGIVLAFVILQALHLI